MKKKTASNNNSFSVQKDLADDGIKDGELSIFWGFEDNKKGEVALWKAVITQALMDAGSNSNKRQMKYDRAQAIAWLSGATQDFITVCSLADLSPEYVREKSKKAIKRGCVWRKNNLIKSRIKRKVIISKHKKNNTTKDSILFNLNDRGKKYGF